MKMYHFDWVLKDNQRINVEKGKPMFYITRNGKRAGNKKFFSYEEARSYARQLVRKNFKAMWTGTNPPIGKFGYAVKSV